MQQRFVLKNESSELPVFRAKMRTFLSEKGWPEKNTGEWLLVLDEALTNVIRHAYSGTPGEIIVEISDEPSKTEFMIEDHGKRFDPTQAPTPKLPKETPGGLGVHFIRQLTDRFEYDNSFQGGNRIYLMRYKPSSARSGS
ncbi:MAG TPA: ATP-binding protein [Candidatus Omnitrophota bacterium]|nr:ATP-binding protein [Candidatus Omnitrophota bacterium]